MFLYILKLIVSDNWLDYRFHNMQINLNLNSLTKTQIIIVTIIILNQNSIIEWIKPI